MNRTIGPILVILVVVGSITVSGQVPDRPRREFLSALKEGQAVTLKETAGRFEISTIDDIPGPLGYKVSQLGHDYVTLVDIAGVTETRIPVYSIKAIVRLNALGKQP